MDYLCAKFSDFNFSRFGFIVRKDRQTDMRMIAILMRLPTPMGNVNVTK